MITVSKYYSKLIINLKIKISTKYEKLLIKKQQKAILALN